MTGWPLRTGITVLALIAIGLIHHETAASIARTWTNSPTYTHGWLILPFSAWLIWRRGDHIAVIQPRIWWPALLAVAALELLWMAAAIAGVVGPQQAVLIALIPAIVFLLLGPSVGRAIAFPLGYLVFAIPWGNGLIPMLQDVTAHMAVYMLEIIGMPVFFEGRLISIPAGNFEVAEACAGVRYLIAALALGTLYAYLVYETLWRRVLFVVAAAIVPIVANGIRAWGIIMLASLSDMRLAVGVDHLIYGWIFFGIVMFLLFWVGSLWREPEPQPSVAGPGGTAYANGPGPRHEQLRGPISAVLAVVALTLTASLLPDWTARAQPIPETRVSLPPANDGWAGQSDEPQGWYSGFTGADDIGFRRYRTADGTAEVGVLAIHYRRESQDAELVSSLNSLQTDNWNWIGAGQRQTGVGGEQHEVRELRLARGDTDRIVWSWYEIGGWATTSGVMAKGFAAVKRLTGQPGDATLVALGTEYAHSPEEARARLRAFLQDHPRLLGPRGAIEGS